MPLWDFHLAPGILSYQEKEQLSEAITAIYTRMGLPAFYVQVRFNEGTASMFISGKSASKFVSIQIYHVARNIPNPKEGEKFLVKTDSVLTPVFGPKGVQWEYWITESDRALWKING